MTPLKSKIQRVLKRVGVHDRLRASSLYDLYWRLADPRLVADRTKELQFYRRVLGATQGELIFDIGANDGAKAKIFLDLGARVVAVEPDRANQRILREKFLKYRLRKLPLIIVGKAAGESSGLATMWVESPGSAVNTLSRKWAESLEKENRHFEQKLGFTDNANVEMTTIEHLIADYGVPCYIKIDVEGYELNVLRGIRRPVPQLSFEVNLPEFRQEGLECLDVLENLAVGGAFNFVVEYDRGMALDSWLGHAEFSRAFGECKHRTIEVFWRAPAYAQEQLTRNSQECSTPRSCLLRNAGGPVLSLLTGGLDKHYTFGLATALAGAGLGVEIIGGDGVDCPEYRTTPGIRFLNLRGGKKSDANLVQKIGRVWHYYWRLLRYAATAQPKIFHVLWNNKFESFDRTFLMLYYKLLGKRVVLTAHNVNQRARDGRDSFLNRLTLRAQYHLADQIFVHTEKMKRDICTEFGVDGSAVVTIPYPINNAVPVTALTRHDARQALGIRQEDRAILFFGNLRPSKGLEYLVAAVESLSLKDTRYRMIIAGERKRGTEQYVDAILRQIREKGMEHCVIERIEYIPDKDVEIYFKASDVFVLPYTDIFQSGILFLGFNFGLPAVVADVGSLRSDVIEGETGFVCRPRDPLALASAIEQYFESDLYVNLDTRRHGIAENVQRAHSWKTVAATTAAVYSNLLESCS